MTPPPFLYKGTSLRLLLVRSRALLLSPAARRLLRSTPRRVGRAKTPESEGLLLCPCWAGGLPPGGSCEPPGSLALFSGSRTGLANIPRPAQQRRARFFHTFRCIFSVIKVEMPIDLKSV